MARNGYALATAPPATASSLNINFCHSNAESVSAHLHDLQTAVFDNQLHVLGISESFLKPTIASRLVEIPGFKLFRVDRLSIDRGGVAIYVHESISVREVCRSPQSEIYVKRPEFLFLELSVGRSKLLCGTIYSVPHCGHWSDVEEAILNCNNTYDATIIMGDFNINWLVSCSTRRILFDSLISCGLERVPFDATHHPIDKSPSAIDYICISDLSLVTKHKQVHCPAISRHDLIFVSLAFSVPSIIPRIVTRRSYRSFSPERLQHDLAALDWQALVDSRDLDNKVATLTDAITSAYDTHAPFRTFTVKSERCPWITPPIRRLINERNKAWKRFKRVGGTNARSHFNSLRNRVQTDVRNAKFNFFKSKLSNASSSTDMWRTLSELGLSKRSQDTPTPFDADTLNSHFVNAATPSANLPCRPTAYIAPDERFFFRHVEAADVIEATNSARSNAAGPDGIRLRQLKVCLPVILTLLLHIFDFSFQSGIFPTLWKRAVVRPLPKNNKATSLSDFRPISILCSISKILESLATMQIRRFIADRGILDVHQSGFRKGFSTHSALVKMVDDFRGAINSQRITLLVTIDFSRAFDVMDINVLIDKLRTYGFSDSSCRWIRSFLSGRTQTVVLPDGSKSTPLSRSTGVPQGSVLGPLLFSLFINDLPSALQFCKCHLYADDFVIYCSGSFKDINSIIERINLDLANVSRWASDNGLAVNASKTQAMWIGSRRYMTNVKALNTPSVLLDSNIIHLSDSLKVLGITIDSSLTWRDQCNVTAKKSFAALARLRKNQGFLPSSMKLLLIKTLIFPYFDYCASLFLGLTEDLTIKLKRCMNAAVRFATGTKLFDHITPDYISNQLLPLTQRREYLVLCFLASVLKSGNPPYLASRFKFMDPDRVGSKRGSSLDLKIEGFSKEYMRHSFYIGAAYLWNDLPHSLRQFYKTSSFKHRLYKFIFDRAY